MSSVHVVRPDLTRERVAETYETIRPYVRRTPVLEARGAEFGLDDFPLAFKLESLQHSGSFKARGAFTHLLLREIADAGVVAASGGNHGAAVAYAAMRLKKRATIFVPEISSPAKIARIKEYGAHLVLAGQRYADALEASERWRLENGATPIPAFDAVENLLGTATIALELEDQLPHIDTVIVAVGGGGLIGGIAAYLEGRVKVVAVEPQGAPKLTRALEAGGPVDAETDTIAADSLAPRRIGTLNYDVLRRCVASVILVADAELREAQARLWTKAAIVTEPGGAAAAAALTSGRYKPSPSERVCVIISGANTIAVDFTR